jgi:hypothetical protein
MAAAKTLLINAGMESLKLVHVNQNYFFKLKG